MGGWVKRGEKLQWSMITPVGNEPLLWDRRVFRWIVTTIASCGWSNLVLVVKDLFAQLLRRRKFGVRRMIRYSRGKDTVIWDEIPRTSACVKLGAIT